MQSPTPFPTPPSSPAPVRRPVPVATVLTPTERARVDAAGDGFYEAYHRDSVAEVVQDLKSNRVNAVLVSVARCDARSRSGAAASWRLCPKTFSPFTKTRQPSSAPSRMVAV